MDWNINKSRPICPQICEQICVLIVKKEVGAKEKIPSVRDLATKLGVNPNTVQKAFETLEAQGIIYSIRGSGWYVSEDVNLASQVVDSLLKRKTREYFEGMQQLGYDAKQTKDFINERFGDWDE